jgi:Flp pilus assembly protein CpaB
MLMAKTIARLRPLTPPSTNGSGGAERRQPVELASPTRRKPSWILLGALLVGFSALLGAWIFASSSERTSVMVAARDIDPGEVIDSTDLRAVEIGGSTGLRAIQPSQQELIVGRAARGPIPAGTVVNTDLFVEVGQSIPPGFVVAGAALAPGATPVSGLRAGDRVDVLALARTTAGLDDGANGAAVLTTGTVWTVEPAGSGTSVSEVWVSVLLPADAQSEFAQAAGDGLLRLSLLGAGE